MTCRKMNDHMALDYFSAEYLDVNDPRDVSFDYTLSGRGVCGCCVIADGSALLCSRSGESITAHGGDLLFLPARSKYRITWGQGANRYYLFDFSFILKSVMAHVGSGEILRDTVLIRDFLPDWLPDRVTVVSGDFIGAAKDTFDSFSDGSYKYYGHFFRLLELVSAGAGDYRVMPGANETPSLTERLRPAIEFIERNYHLPISLGDIAESAGISASYLSHSFRGLIGMTPMEYADRLRVRSAMKALVMTDKTIERVAAELSFSSPARFRSVFRSLTGATPGEYRKSNSRSG